MKCSAYLAYCESFLRRTDGIGIGLALWARCNGDAMASDGVEGCDSFAPAFPEAYAMLMWRTLRSGNVLIETAFFDDDLLVCKMVLRVFYDL